MIPLAQWLAERERIAMPPLTGIPAAVGMQDREHAEALEQLKASLLAEYEQRIDNLTRAHACDMEAARKAWCREEAARMTDQLQSAIASLEQSLSDHVAACLSPVLAEAMTARAMRAFADRLRSITGDDTVMGLRIEGPAILLDRIRQALGDRTDAVKFQESDGIDVNAWVNGTLVQSCLKPWADALAEELA
ncbi:hypothetical protein [Aestuariivirga sp.]|uniref:hypothetical protein n=1 Tax=Aestuariivirga sp. TaxID=2650926 RepID=UPI0039E6C106